MACFKKHFLGPKTEMCVMGYLKIEKSYYYNSVMLPKYFKFYFSSFKLESFKHFVVFVGKLFEVISPSDVRDKFISAIRLHSFYILQ